CSHDTGHAHKHQYRQPTTPRGYFHTRTGMINKGMQQQQMMMMMKSKQWAIGSLANQVWRPCNMCVCVCVCVFSGWVPVESSFIPLTKPPHTTLSPASSLTL
ncbi:unnamed protein product, partial [Ectocarpus sp. 12 AP-2014]